MVISFKKEKSLKAARDVFGRGKKHDRKKTRDKEIESEREMDLVLERRKI